MPITTLSSLEFDQDTRRAKAAAENGPVFITDSGRTAHVLLTAEEYHRVVHGEKSIAELLSCPEAAEIDLESEIPPRLISASRPLNLD